MKNYFNDKERTNHIILMCMEYVAEEFSSSNALTDKEKKEVGKIIKACKNLNESLYERFGEPYRRKIEGTLKNNTLRLIGKYAPYNECISYCASEDIEPKIREVMLFYCLGCEECNFKDCAMYAMALTCGVCGSCDNGCPYKREF